MNNDQEKLDKIKSEIMEKIQTGKLRLHSNFYIYIKKSFIVFAIIFVMAVFSYSMSFVTLWLRVQIVQIFHDGASLGYIIKLFNTFPIIELLISVMLLVILIVLIRKIDRWYRMRVVSTFLLMFAVFSLIGLGVSYFQLDNIFQIKHTSAISRNI